MALTISNDSKNTLSVSNETKSTYDPTWDEANFTWDEAGDSTWDGVYLAVSKESKNTSLSISNETKN